MTRPVAGVDADHEEWAKVDCEHLGVVNVRLVRPTAITDPVPAIVFLRGGGLVSEATDSRDRLVQQLVLQTGAAVVCPDYGSAWGARYPQTVEQIYAVCRWVIAHGAAHGIDPTRLAIAGDSAGATLAISVALMSVQRNEFAFRFLAAFCPLTAPDLDTASHRPFTGLPPTLIITAEADPVRDEGEALAALLRQADVPTTSVRYGGAVHDFVALDALAETESAKAALRQATSLLALALGCSATSGVNPAAPPLTDGQWDVLTSYGTHHDVPAGETLFQAGQSGCDMIVVEAGTVEVVRRATADSAEMVVAHYGPRQFTGELNLLTGQATYFEARVVTAGTIVRIDPHEFRRLMDEQPDLSDVILRSLVARRQNLLTRQAGTIEILAGAPSALTLALHTYLDRLQLPFTWTDFRSEAGTRLAHGTGLSAADLPAVITAESVIRRATPNGSRRRSAWPVAHSRPVTSTWS